MEQENSILTSIKKMIGITEEYTHFDQDIIMHINSVFMILNQMGVGPDKAYSILDKNNTWDEFMEDDDMLHAVKSYVYLKVKMLFDPPSSSSIMDSMNRQISELEWRLNVAAENNAASGEEESQNGS